MSRTTPLQALMNSIHASARSATPAARPPVSAARNTRSVSGQLGEVRNTNDQRSRADADSNWRRPPPRASDAGIDGNRGAHWRQPAALPARQEQQGPRVLEPRLRAYRN